jgi:hypothetical protein
VIVFSFTTAAGELDEEVEPELVPEDEGPQATTDAASSASAKYLGKCDTSFAG